MKLLQDILPHLMKRHDKALKNGYFPHGAPEDGSVISHSMKTSRKLQLSLGRNKTKQKLS